MPTYTIFSFLALTYAVEEPPLQSNIITNNNVNSAIVKIYTVAKKTNSKMLSMTGSGSIIANNRILTNAHVIADNTFIEVKRYGKTKRYETQVVSVSHEADLAIAAPAQNPINISSNIVTQPTNTPTPSAIASSAETEPTSGQ